MTTRDFFVSYTGADLPWARWIAWELEAAGYTTVIQEWDFQAGSNFVLEMHRAAHETDRTLAVLSSRYLEALFTQPEWAAALVTDPTGVRRHLVPVRIEECKPDGLLTALGYIDLVGLDEADARAKLRESIAGILRGRNKPTVPPPSPMGQGLAAAGRPRFATALPPVWNLPYRRNPTFTGREEALAALARQLGRGEAAAVTQAIQGVGGIGKTAVVTEYAWRHRAEFEVVWWVRAEEPATLVGDLAELAVALDLAEAAAADQQAAVVAVRRWLESHDRWLLVLDNAEGPQAETGLRAPLRRLADMLPRAMGGQVLVTSRDASWDVEAELVELDLLSPEEARQFLLRRTGSEDDEAATEVAELLGYLALALEQAGAYVRETRISLVDYLDRLRKSPMRTLKRGRPRDRNPADTVATTWQVSLERVGKVPGAVALLEVCAFLAPDDIPRELFAQRVRDQPKELGILARDPFALDDAVAALHRYALIKASEQALGVHRLVQQVISDRLDTAAAGERAGVAVRLLRAAFPTKGLSDLASWPVCERLLSSVLAATDYAEKHTIEAAETGPLLDRAATYLQGRGRYTEARILFVRALTLIEQAFGPEDRRTSAVLNNLGLLLHRVGDDAGAKVALERSLAVKETIGEFGDLALATTLDNLGQALHGLGNLDGARQHHERALTIKQTVLGPDDPSVAITLSNLGAVLRDLRYLDGARQYLERAVTIKQTALGSDDPEVAATLNNLGLVLRDLGDLDGARQYLEQVLAIQEAALGPDHPSTGITLDNLGQVLRDLGDLDGARQYLQRALVIYQTTMGPEHDWTQDLGGRVADL